MTVRLRLFAAFGMVMVLLAIPAVFAAARLADLQNLAVEGRGRHAAASLSMGRFEADLARLDFYLRSYVAAPNRHALQQTRASLASLQQGVDHLEESRYLDAALAVAPMVEALHASTRQVEALVAQGRLEEATSAFVGLEPLMDEARKQLVRAAASVDRQARQDFARAHDISASARRDTLLAIGFGLVVAAMVGGWATGAITSPIRRLVSATAQVADGSFRDPEDLPYARRDEIGDLSRSFRTMTQHLAELDRMKAEFVGVASHELKTPINVIRGYTELIEEELSGDVTEQQQEILHGIAEQSRAMSHLVSRLMDISRLEAGSYRLEMEEVHLEDLVTGLVRSFDLVAAREGVELNSRIDETAPDVLYVDVDIVRDEVLGNLVSNAIKFTPAGGEVRISAWGRAGEAIFEVSDTGPGVPEAHRAHVFDKYYQVERSRSMGSGLGLAIAREMIEAHGGTIRLLSTPEPGATFQVSIPARRPESEPPPRRPAEAGVPAGA